MVKVPIPGKTFVLECSGLLNINVEHLETSTSKERKVKRMSKFTRALFFAKFFVFVYFAFITHDWVYELWVWLGNYFIGHNLLNRLFAAFIVAQALSLLIPSPFYLDKDDKETTAIQSGRQPIDYRFDKDILLVKFGFLILLIIIYVSINY